MSDSVVVAIAFLVSYGVITGYALFLHMRSRSAGN